MRRDHKTGRAWPAPLAEIGYHWHKRRERRKERPAKPGVPQAAPEGALRVFRAVALWGIAVLILTAAGSAFAESYRGLWLWAGHHGLAGLWAILFPLQVDLFVAVGELVLFIAMTDRWGLAGPGGRVGGRAARPGGLRHGQRRPRRRA